MAEKNAGFNGHTIKLLAPAKVNLFLKVLSKRPDGYHEILSLMQPVSLCDEVTVAIREGSGISVTCPGSAAPEGKGNIAWKAAETFLSEAGLKAGVDIEIIKRIPAGAGLGGGSSDAASVLMGMEAITGARLGEARLVEIASKIGSDVPFFILNGSAIARGRGEALQRVEAAKCHYVLVNPGFEVSTAWAYGNLGLTKGHEDNTLSYSVESLMDFDGITGLLSNDLERVTIGRYPEIGSIKKELIEAGAAGALMSGSGSTVFGIFRCTEAAQKALERLKPAGSVKGYRYFLAEGI